MSKNNRSTKPIVPQSAIQMPMFNFDEPQKETPKEIVITPKEEPRKLKAPELIALGGEEWNAFPLQKQIDNDIEMWAVQDWIRGVTGKSDTRQALKDLKLNHPEMCDSFTPLPYLATDGKTYHREYADDITLYKIVGHLRIDSALRDKIITLMAKALHIVDEGRVNPSTFIEAGIDVYKLEGRADSWIDERIKLVDDFKLLCISIDRVCDTPQYGVVINAEYMALFGHVADGLKKILGVKNVRDGLPELQLVALRFAEVSLRQLLDQSDKMTTNKICENARKICLPIGEHLKTVSAILGIDPITGDTPHA